MPKTYSDNERAYIKKRLKEEAQYCLANYGVRRTTVDELVTRVKIPKGTFYLFYDSKEILLFEVLQEQQEKIDTKLFDEIKALTGNITVDKVTDIIYKYFKVADESVFLRLLTTGEIDLLYRKLPQEIIQNHLVNDDKVLEQIINLFSLSKDISVKQYSTAFMNLFITMVHKREMSEDYFDEALRLTIRGLVLQLVQ